MRLRATLTRLIVVASASLAWGQSTNFNASFATAPGMQLNQYQLSEEVSVLMSAGNVYYDEPRGDPPALYCVPLQAYEITDQNGNPLGPYLMTTQEIDSYVLDVTSLDTNCADTDAGEKTCKPYHRGTQLTAATDRGWRIDYYKPNAQTGTLWSTVMSGPISQLDDTNYELQVDLGLRWSEEGDNLNRLGQGQFSHIALAIGDFRSFNWKTTNPGAGRLSANVITASPTMFPTTPPSSSEPTAPPTASPASSDPTAAPATNEPSPAPSTGGPTPAPTPIPTPQSDDGFTQPTGDATLNPVEVTTLAATTTEEAGSGDDSENREQEEDCSQSGLSPKSAKRCVKDNDEQNRFVDGCTMSYDKKGMGHWVNSKGKKCENNKAGKGFQSASAAGLDQRSSLLVASTCAVFLMSGWALVSYRNKQLQAGGYIPVDPTETYEHPPDPIVPTSFAAFGTFSADDLKVAASAMRLPPSEYELSLPNTATAIN